MNALPDHIGREDIERKLRELQQDVEHVGASARSYALAVGTVLAVAIVSAAFLLGRRRGKRRSTVVEIRRI